MKTDRNGCSTCVCGQEQYETFRTPGGREAVQYDYRDVDGELFSTVAPTLEEARECCTRWLNQRTVRGD
jgi:hypothetical protein